MQLKKLTIENFRSCVKTEVQLSGDITVLVGENASGKTAIIDAIRLGTQSALEGRSISFTPDRDLSHTAIDGEFSKIQFKYENLTPGQMATFLPQVVDEDDSLIYTYTFNPVDDMPYWKRTTHSVGSMEVVDAEPGTRLRLGHVYLQPLRDAVRELDGAGGDRLAEVLKVLTAGDNVSRMEFVDGANEILEGVKELPLAKQARIEIETHLEKITPPSRKHGVHFDGRRHELRRLANMMKLQLTEAGISPKELGSSGLGYANLVFIATIVLQLAKARDYDLTLLLVEEPEAHLHPQLQSVLLEYLKQQAKDSGRKEDEFSTEPAGRIQVVVSTHSPQLASAVKVEDIVVVSRQMQLDDTSLAPEQNDSQIPISSGDVDTEKRSTKTMALSQLGIKESEYRKINRYLNSTRSALLFARHILLIEGIAESILIPEVARRHPQAGSEEAKRHLSSVAYIPVDGVDFEPYLKLILNGDYPRVDRVIVLTDGDTDKAGVSQGVERKKRIEKAFPQDIADGRLSVHHGSTTLEADIFGIPSNEKILKSAFVTMHPRSAKKWDEAFGELPDDADERSREFSRMLKLDKGGLDLGKGDFAQLVAESLYQGEDLVLPGYINEAVEAVLGKFSASDKAHDVRSVEIFGG